jgi:hypothetical protein
VGFAADRAKTTLRRATIGVAPTGFQGGGLTVPNAVRSKTPLTATILSMERGKLSKFVGIAGAG